MADEADFLDLPDDQIVGMSAPPAAPTQPGTTSEVGAVETSSPPAAASEASGEATTDEGTTPPAAPAAEAEGGGVDRQSDDAALSAADDADLTPPGVTPPVDASAEPAKKDEAGDTPPKTETAAETGEPGKSEKADETAKPDAPKAPTADDHKALYDLVLGQPIKANGKEIKLQSPDEVVKLVQMGLNYTKKMQSLQGSLRVVKMLENNQLLDEAKLSHLIDISKGDAGAIQKLLADTGFNPMEADAEKAASYKPTDHRVTEAEMSFEAVLDEVQQSSAGVELISEVHGQWDAESKRALFQEPTILSLLAAQKANGLYTQITSEVDRLRALGEIKPEIPFLQAYHAVGAMLHDQGRLGPKKESTAAEPAVPAVPAVPAAPAAPVEVRVAAPAPQVTKTTQAQATAPVRAAPSNPTPPSADFLSMDDAAFAKQFGTRA